MRDNDESARGCASSALLGSRLAKPDHELEARGVQRSAGQKPRRKKPPAGFKWIRAVEDFIEPAEMTPVEAALLRFLALKADRAGWSYWKLARIEAHLKFKETAIKGARAGLVAMGAIEVVTRGGRGQANAWRVIVPLDAAELTHD